MSVRPPRPNARGRERLVAAFKGGHLGALFDVTLPQQGLGPRTKGSAPRPTLAASQALFLVKPVDAGDTSSPCDPCPDGLTGPPLWQVTISNGRN